MKFEGSCGMACEYSGLRGLGPTKMAMMTIKGMINNHFLRRRFAVNPSVIIYQHQILDYEITNSEGKLKKYYLQLNIIKQKYIIN
jgi:hypothetical protein